MSEKKRGGQYRLGHERIAVLSDAILEGLETYAIRIDELNELSKRMTSWTEELLEIGEDLISKDQSNRKWVNKRLDDLRRPLVGASESTRLLARDRSEFLIDHMNRSLALPTSKRYLD